MQKTLTLLRTSPIIKNYQILELNTGPDYFHIKARATLKDNSLLFIKEFVSSDDLKYSYHWQSSDNQLISRWDNAEHHPEISSFPHHKHSPDVEESYFVDLEDVLNEIGETINQQ